MPLYPQTIARLKTEIDAQRDEAGTLRAYSPIGGYPLYYAAGDYGIVCPACASGQNGSRCTAPDLDPESAEDRPWIIVEAQPWYEGAPLTCSHCEATIESAYGDPTIPN
ncbi:MAG: hypothetical protein M3Q75_14550 [Gemmatimonadota bacterium]|nr:hypothetical protein [Gemmatimonadota bacterium]